MQLISFATLSQCVCPTAYDLAPDRVTCVERAEAEGVCHPMVVSPGMELKCTGGDPVGPEGTFPRGAICRGRCAVGYVADGRLKIVLDAASPFPFTEEGVKAAFALVESGRAHGKVSVKM